eukprot:scaffold332043_cov36-Prasinocladus_malaysianus.AAC.1
MGLTLANCKHVAPQQQHGNCSLTATVVLLRYGTRRACGSTKVDGSELDACAGARLPSVAGQVQMKPSALFNPVSEDC